MKSASSWPRVLRLTYAAVLPLYFACGMLGYAAYGDFANANINVNFPDNLANQASIVVQMVQEVRFLRSCRPRHAANLTLTPTFTLTPTLALTHTRSTSYSRPTSSSCSPSSSTWASTRPPAALPAPSSQLTPQTPPTRPRTISWPPRRDVCACACACVCVF